MIDWDHYKMREQETKIVPTCIFKQITESSEIKDNLYECRVCNGGNNKQCYREK